MRGRCKICDAVAKVDRVCVCDLCKFRAANKAGIVLIPIPHLVLPSLIETGALEQSLGNTEDFIH